MPNDRDDPKSAGAPPRDSTVTDAPQKPSTPEKPAVKEPGSADRDKVEVTEPPQSKDRRN
jgi:hypothetical protein